jgi:flavodoxin
MKVAIVYESMFGNTHQVAEAIRDGVQEAQPQGQVDLVPVTDATPGACQMVCVRRCERG